MKVVGNINPYDIGFHCNKWCYVWRDNYHDIFKEYTDYTYLIYALTGVLAPPGMGGEKMFKRKVKFTVEKSEDGEKHRACIKEVF